MKKIFIIGNVASMMINFRKELIIKLVNDGNEVFCLASDYTDEQKSQIYSFGAKPLDYLLNAKGVNPFKDILATLNLINLIKQNKPDILFSFFVKPVIFGSIAAKLAKVPKIVAMIEGLGNAFTEYKFGLTKKAKVIKFIQIQLYKVALPLVDELIFLNNDDKKDLIQAYKIKVKSVYILGGIGVDLDKFRYSPAPTNPVVFIFIARLLAQKGIFEFLEAAKIIKTKYPQATFKIFGSLEENNPFGLSLNELDSYIKSGIVEYAGFSHDITLELQKSSVFVLPSYREGVPRSSQEAASTGRAIITTNYVGCKETIIDGLSGFLIPRFDSVALAKKMEFFIQNPEQIIKMGENSRKFAEEKFDIAKINEKLSNIILK
ncbi:glycosyltransferase, family 1 [Campylobacter iguaniorum]|uniref:glycosyltransferase family 4 protein n=1 Tax=Campylobacter iguaniorum TaxID=1244531 RepID=UPI0007C8EAF2|nr:glycosyltransferase family 4 protein [Campylobacter iguaniorum]ANE35136.1 glycosyltransferase, family 1 [Campylobacter iguaniorum]